MGVLSCSRDGCSNIMCDTYVDGIGYICTECQEEFKEYILITGSRAASHNGIHHALETYMETSKGEYHKNIQSSKIDEFFEKYTRK